jgi:hypothetical protein
MRNDDPTAEQATPAGGTAPAETAATGPATTDPATTGPATETATTGLATETAATGPAPADPQPAAPPEQSIWDSGEAEQFRHRWHDVQTRFVEDPPASVAEARQLVDDAVRALADNVHSREEQVAQGGARAADSTEGMRDTVLQYHHLLDRLLSV